MFGRFTLFILICYNFFLKACLTIPKKYVCQKKNDESIRSLSDSLRLLFFLVTVNSYQDVDYCLQKL